MKSASPELITFLNTSQQFCMADIYEIAPVIGNAVRYTTADVDLVWGGYTWSHTGPILSRSSIRWAIGLEVDELSMTVSATMAELINGTPWPTALRYGALDDAQITLRRLIMPTWGDTSLGAVLLFRGRVADVDIQALEAEISVQSDLHKLNAKVPRNIYGPGCMNTLFDSVCGVSRAAHQVSTSVSATWGVPSTTSIPIAAATAAGHFDLGTIEFTSGANAGLKRAVKLHTSHVVRLALPLPVAPANGDTCIVTPGCDKRETTCTSKFSNRPNFRGCPYVPAPETAA